MHRSIIFFLKKIFCRNHSACIAKQEQIQSILTALWPSLIIPIPIILIQYFLNEVAYQSCWHSRIQSSLGPPPLSLTSIAFIVYAFKIFKKNQKGYERFGNFIFTSSTLNWWITNWSRKVHACTNIIVSNYTLEYFLKSTEVYLIIKDTM